VTAASGDHLIIEDASDSNNKKRIAASDFLSPDHGGLAGLADDDHTQYLLQAGTRYADALLIKERTDHVNSPTSGYHEIWADSDDSKLKHTTEGGVDRILRSVTSINQTGTVTVSDTANWIGQSPTDMWSATWNTTYGASSGNPACPTIYGNGILAPFACHVSADIWMRWGTTSPAGTIELWKFAYSDGGSSETPTQLGTVTITGTNTSNVYRHQITSEVAVAAGDRIHILFKMSASGGTATMRGMVLMMEVA
jgi:hypothetical protein